jgi:hypothetical protein
MLMLGLRPVWAATQVDGLYVGEAIVTGRDADAERDRGLREALAAVVIKLSGDSRLAQHPDLPKLLDEAPRIIASLSYLDRLAKKKLMDEQGTRQRSYLMTVEFQHEAVDRMLTTLAVHPWPASRPTVLVLLAVQDLNGAFALGAEGERGWGQREAFADSARRRGVPVVLPRMDAEDQATLAQGGGVAALKQTYHADAVLMGSMVMRPAGTWDTGWTLLREPALPEVFNADDTTFDRAIQTGVERTARALAGYE